MAPRPDHPWTPVGDADLVGCVAVTVGVGASVGSGGDAAVPEVVVAWWTPSWAEVGLGAPGVLVVVVVGCRDAPSGSGGASASGGVVGVAC